MRNQRAAQAAVEALRLQASQLQNLQEQIDALTRLRADMLTAHEGLAAQLVRSQQDVARWEWFFEHSLDLLCICGFDGRFRRVNLAFEKALGHTRDELLASSFWDFIHPEDLARTKKQVLAVIRGADSVTFESRYRHRDGSWRWLSWNCPAVREGDDHLHVIARDITGDKLSAQEILYRAQHDPLTGLGNRALFEQTLTMAMARVERTASREVALMLLDLDGFKSINDTYGHGAGDHVLRVVSQRLRDKLRRIDVPCRIGGDEFALIVEGFAPIQLERIAEKVIRLVSEEVTWSEAPLQVSGSLGYVTFPEPARTSDDLLALADAAMYAAKQSGKNCFVRYNASQARLPAWALSPAKGEA
jgi:diguanylate cyclase (GGDEF)-like protein/PAS domain S-box-containing protein